MKWKTMCLLAACFFASARFLCAAETSMLAWDSLPELPDELGVAGPFVGVHNDALIVAGGANFPRPVWQNDKVWRDRIHVLTHAGDEWVWRDGGTLKQPLAYGASVSTPQGVVCIGGNDADATYDRVFLMRWDASKQQVTLIDYPSLPEPCAFGSAAVVGDVVYLAGGQHGPGLETAMTNFWSLDLSQRNHPEAFVWQRLSPWPGPPRALNLTVTQHNGFNECVYVISGRSPSVSDTREVEFLKDVWEYTPESHSWRKRADAPRCVMGAPAMALGPTHIGVLGGDDGSLFFDSDKLKDQHPGFPKQALAYHTITNTWTDAGAMPGNQVTTTAVPWNGAIVIPSGEVRPRVRSPHVARVVAQAHQHHFGMLNSAVLLGYLLAMLGVGFYFARRSKNTNDYFRGAQHIPWWAAGCSIFATMLSSLTFTGIPSKAYAQDWVYSIGNFMIPIVSVVAVFVALPFFRRIDATSAYEYLEVRFSRPMRWFGSASFSVFHIFRIAIVMSLTGLAMAVATPLSPSQSVLLMGGLSVIYCTMGGIEAVIWTDTIQTLVLIGGALTAIGLLIAGVDGQWHGFVAVSTDANKFAMANFHADVTNSQIALWVIVVGAIAQNLSSYTADQAVVQRYMTTANERLAARAIWTNAVLTIPATVLFFGIGTALFAFYHSHPEKLDPTISNDQIFPLFIAHEMPVGVAGLIVAAVLAAAQSTVSTSMNSTATTIVTDFMRPLGVCKTESSYLNAARWGTLVIGVVGTLLGLVFVNPEIRSLFDAFIKVIGLFMGVLGALFILGALTRRANAAGAMIGAIAGSACMFCLWLFTDINGYLYSACGIGTCFAIGYAASLVVGRPPRNLAGLTIYTLNDPMAKREPIGNEAQDSSGK